MPNSYSHETLFFKKTSDKCIDTLRQALQATCTLIPIFNGKLAIDQPGRPPVIFHGQYSVQKMLTIHNLADNVDYQDLKDACLRKAAERTPVLSEAIRLLSLAPPYSLQIDGEAPVLRLTGAILRGGLALTINFHHLAFDLTSIAVFLRILSAYCRDETPPPLSAECVSRDILRNVSAADYEHHLAALNERIKPVAKPESKEHSVVAAAEQVNAVPPPPPPLASAMVHFSDRALAQLKADVTAHLDPTSGPAWISTNDALMALAWSCITSASAEHDTHRIAVEGKRSAICMAVNLRHRLSPRLPTDYLGAAVCAPPFSAPIELLRSASSSYTDLACLAQRIRAKVNTIDAEYVRRCFDTTSPPLADDEEEQDATALMPTGPIDLTINSWAEQGACLHDWGKDFGGSCECAIRLNARSPSVYVMPRLPVKPNGGGGLLVHTTLEEETMERLRAVSYTHLTLPTIYSV